MEHIKEWNEILNKNHDWQTAVLLTYISLIKHLSGLDTNRDDEEGEFSQLMAQYFFPDEAM